MPIDTTNTDVEISGAGEEYEYNTGTYLDMLQMQLGAIKNQQELEKEKEEEDEYNAPLGERNMGYLNTYLALRGTVETLRDTALLNKAGDMGGVNKEGEPGGWRQKKTSKLGNIARTLTGWSPGIEAIPEDEKPEPKVAKGTTSGEYTESKFHVENVKEKLTNEATDTNSKTQFYAVNQADTPKNRKKIDNIKKTGNPNEGSYGSGSSSPKQTPERKEHWANRLKEQKKLAANNDALKEIKDMKKDGRIKEATTKMMNNQQYVQTSYGWKKAGL